LDFKRGAKISREGGEKSGGILGQITIVDLLSSNENILAIVISETFWKIG
jgi:hypothetical protein